MGPGVLAGEDMEVEVGAQAEGEEGVGDQAQDSMEDLAVSGH